MKLKLQRTILEAGEQAIFEEGCVCLCLQVQLTRRPVSRQPSNYAGHRIAPEESARGCVCSSISRVVEQGTTRRKNLITIREVWNPKG